MEILLLVLSPIATFVLGVIATWIADRRKYRREDDVRWIQERMTTYSTFVSECDDWLEAAWERRRIEGLYSWITGPYEGSLLTEPVGESRDRVASLRKSEQSLRDSTRRLLAGIEFLASPAVLAAAKQYREYVLKVISVAREFPPHGCGGVHDDLYAADQEWAAARAELFRFIRAELGVDAEIATANIHVEPLEYARGRALGADGAYGPRANERDGA